MHTSGILKPIKPPGTVLRILLPAPVAGCVRQAQRLSKEGSVAVPAVRIPKQSLCYRQAAEEKRQGQPAVAGCLPKEAVLNSLKEAYWTDTSGMHFWEVARSHRYACPMH